MADSILIRSASRDDAAVIADYNAAMALETEHKRLVAAVLRAGVERAIALPEGRVIFWRRSMGAWWGS